MRRARENQWAAGASGSERHHLKLLAMAALAMAARLSAAAVPAVPVAAAFADSPPPMPPYSDAMCKPATLHPADPLPPCIDIENIETICWPNGTAPLYLAAHAQCMCGGSFFAEWNACRRCLAVHGQLPDSEWHYYQAVATAASSSLCGFLTSGSPVSTTPTAIFQDLFTSAEATIALPAPSGIRPPPGASRGSAGVNATAVVASAGAGGASAATTTVPSSSDASAGVAVPPPPDPLSGITDVSLYYTPTSGGHSGPGPITGSATAATATGLVVATGHAPTPPSASAPVVPYSGSSSGKTSGLVRSSAPHSRAPETAALLQRAAVSLLLLVVF